jgi:hypothetical protein
MDAQSLACSVAHCLRVALGRVELELIVSRHFDPIDKQIRLLVTVLVFTAEAVFAPSLGDMLIGMGSKLVAELVAKVAHDTLVYQG